jgi:hypothetical protein
VARELGSSASLAPLHHVHRHVRSFGPGPLRLSPHALELQAKYPASNQSSSSAPPPLCPPFATGSHNTHLAAGCYPPCAWSPEKKSPSFKFDLSNLDIPNGMNDHFGIEGRRSQHRTHPRGRSGLDRAAANVDLGRREHCPHQLGARRARHHPQARALGDRRSHRSRQHHRLRVPPSR